MTIQLSPLLKGLVLHAPLDQESYSPATKRFTDLGGYANHGTSANAASFVADRMGQADRAMDFNGSSDYVDCGNADSLDITDAITISMWLSLEDITYNQRIIGKATSSPNYIGYALLLTGSSMRWLIGDGSEWQIVTDCSPDMTSHQWAHIVCVFDDNDGSGGLYVDGNEKEYTTGHNPVVSATTSLKIGTYFSGGYVYGSIDDVRIYNRALSEEEIALLYESYRPRLII